MFGLFEERYGALAVHTVCREVSLTIGIGVVGRQQHAVIPGNLERCLETGNTGIVCIDVSRCPVPKLATKNHIVGFNFHNGILDLLVEETGAKKGCLAQVILVSEIQIPRCSGIQFRVTAFYLIVFSVNHSAGPCLSKARPHQRAEYTKSHDLVFTQIKLDVQ